MTKKFENRLTFSEVMGKNLVSCLFLAHSVDCVFHLLIPT